MTDPLITRGQWFRANSSPNVTPASQERVYPETPARGRVLRSDWSDPLGEALVEARARNAARAAEQVKAAPPPPAVELRFTGDIVRQTGMHAYPKRGERFVEPKRRLPPVQAGRG